MCKYGREIERGCMCVEERDYVCVCVRERDRERDRERERERERVCKRVEESVSMGER